MNLRIVCCSGEQRASITKAKQILGLFVRNWWHVKLIGSRRLRKRGGMVKGSSSMDKEEMLVELDCIAACSSPGGQAGGQVGEGDQVVNQVSHKVRDGQMGKQVGNGGQ